MIYMFLSNNPSSGDINSSNLSCFSRSYNIIPNQNFSFIQHRGPFCVLIPTINKRDMHCVWVASDRSHCAVRMTGFPKNSI